ncbi:hypothetical protein JW872_03755, partial [Candidatus Babeliales bacterium]|nr:hypothetical protein [Candidatus Babeliales bacterium]
MKKHQKIWFIASIYVGLLILLPYLANSLWMSKIARYLMLAVTFKLYTLFFLGNFIYAAYLLWKKKNLQSVLHTISSLMLLVMLGFATTMQSFTYFKLGWDEWKAAATPQESVIVNVDSYDSLQELVKKHKKPVIVKCSAIWCPPCNAVKPHYHKLAEELKDKITFVEIDTDSFTDAQKLNIKGIPAFIGYKH